MSEKSFSEITQELLIGVFAGWLVMLVGVWSATQLWDGGWPVPHKGWAALYLFFVVRAWRTA